jgi:hypothetical protein
MNARPAAVYIVELVFDDAFEWLRVKRRQTFDVCDDAAFETSHGEFPSAKGDIPWMRSVANTSLYLSRFPDKAFGELTIRDRA